MVENVNVGVALDDDFESVEVVADATEEAVEGLCVVPFAIAEVLLASVTELEEFVIVEAVEVKAIARTGARVIATFRYRNHQ